MEIDTAAVQAVANSDRLEARLTQLRLETGDQVTVFLEDGDDAPLFIRIAGDRGIQRPVEEYIDDGHIPLQDIVEAVGDALGEEYTATLDSGNTTRIEAIYDLHPA